MALLSYGHNVCRCGAYAFYKARGIHAYNAKIPSKAQAPGLFEWGGRNNFGHWPVHPCV